ncbi:MAG: hypothetical protein ACJAUH_002133 [Saprospiraceae bacterium]|jgi:hypothetical protein
MIKKIKLSVIALTLLFFGLNPSICEAAFTSNPDKLQDFITNTDYEDLTQENFEAILGRKLTLKERVGLKVVKNRMAKQQKEGVSNEGDTGKTQIVALLLCIFLGALGIHRFYLGYNGWGIIYLLTGGILGIGWLIDIILLIIPGGLTPKGPGGY